MFAGIVEGVREVVALHPARAPAETSVRRLEIRLNELLEGLACGASVAVNGACLTLAERRGDIGGFDVVPETLRLTNLGTLQPGDGVNVERSLRVGDRIDGHFVQGHVDGLGRVARIDRAGGEWLLSVRPPAELLPYLVRKGSIAVDGISLTVVDVCNGEFRVALIPTTLEKTTLGRRRPGDAVNLETDILARLIVDRLRSDCAGSAAPSEPRAPSVPPASLAASEPRAPSRGPWPRESAARSAPCPSPHRAVTPKAVLHSLLRYATGFARIPGCVA